MTVVLFTSGSETGLSHKSFITPLGCTQPPLQYQKSLPGNKTGRLCTDSGKIKTAWICTSIALCVFVTRCFTEHSGKFTLYDLR